MGRTALVWCDRNPGVKGGRDQVMPFGGVIRGGLAVLPPLDLSARGALGNTVGAQVSTHMPSHSHPWAETLQEL